MADHTHIEWTDATWNPVTGCSVLSPGCTNCYAMRLAGTRLQHHPSRQGLTTPSKAGPVWTGEVRFNAEWLTQPLRWKAARRIFVCAHGDLFHEAVPDAWIDQVFAVMALAPQHTFQVLTKRAARMRDYLRGPWGFAVLGKMGTLRPQARGHELATKNHALPNVHLGVSVEDQARADERIPILLDTPAAVRWISAEPLLGPIDLQCTPWPAAWERPVDDPSDGIHPLRFRRAHLDWVVVGGESGPGARPMHPDWARQIRDDCAAAGVPFHFKQWGEFCPLRRELIPVPSKQIGWVNGQGKLVMPADDRDFTRMDREDNRSGEPFWTQVLRVGKRAAGRMLDGVIHDAFPEAAQ